jgi:phage baseplate assembly protein W
LSITNPSAYYDASSAPNARSVKIYKDIDLNFSRHPVTGDISVVTDVDAVKRSVRNLVQTGIYERHFHPEIGSEVRKSLFEPITPMIASTIARRIEDIIVNFEPRVELIFVDCLGDIDRNEYNVQIQFYLLNAMTDPESMTLTLERLR